MTYCSHSISQRTFEKLQIVKKKFDAHFIQRRNTIFERAKFNCQKQEPGESIDDV